jgi:hypothetical protein
MKINNVIKESHIDNRNPKRTPRDGGIENVAGLVKVSLFMDGNSKYIVNVLFRQRK